MTRKVIKEKKGFSLIEVSKGNSYFWEIFKYGVEIAALGKAKWGHEYIERLSNGCPECGGELLIEDTGIGDLCCADCDLIIDADGTKSFHVKVELKNIVWTRELLLEGNLPKNYIVQIDENDLGEDGKIEDDVLRYALSNDIVFSPLEIGSYTII